jgi:PhoH-like ATPase
MYQGLSVIENFEDWNNWFNKEKKISLNDLPKDIEYCQNMGIVLKSPVYDDLPKTKQHGIVKGDSVVHLKKYHPCGIKPFNTEQSIALELLNDDSIPLVTMLGSAGSGKTLLACAHAMHSLKKGCVEKIVIAKSMTPVGREIGFLKGTLEEKVLPWLGPFRDNMEKCGVSTYDLEKLILEESVEITPITFIQGRSISNSIIIVDEIQNLDMDVIKQVVTRAADNCKILLLGDPSQRFERGSINLEAFVEKGKSSELVGHIFFRKSVRSPIAEWAVQNL